MLDELNLSIEFTIFKDSDSTKQQRNNYMLCGKQKQQQCEYMEHCNGISDLLAEVSFGVGFIKSQDYGISTGS